MNKGRRWGLLLLLLTFSACSQEHFIYTRNLSEAELFSLDQILVDAGIQKSDSGEVDSADAASSVTTTIPESSYSLQTTTSSSAEETNLYRTVAANQEFSVSIYEPYSFIVLDEVPDGITYYEEDSNPDSGFFYFESGNDDAELTFKIYNLGGDLQKVMYYHLSVLSWGSSDDEDESDLSDQITDDVEMDVPDANPSTSVDIVIASLNGLSETEQVKLLEDYIDESDAGSVDRLVYSTNLLDILIEQRSFTQADELIDELSDEETVQAFYRARYYRKKYNYAAAGIEYLTALDGDELLEKAAVLELEEMLLEYGSVQESVVEDLFSRTDEYFDEDEDFYAESMINIARLYEFLWDVYRSEEIYQSIIDGDLPRKWRILAEDYYEELQDNFLYYR